MDKILAISSNQDKILHVTPRQETLLLQKLEKLECVNRELDSMRAFFQERMKSCNSTRMKLENKQSNLKHDMEKFETFIEENAQKRRRSRIKYEQESRVVDQYEREIRNLEVELKKLKER
ncbi:hypothetical protein Ciccas_007455 [Cichlidogyrus casuarinus]|uniref:DUF4200 domain-containing protein n=1 Tax=Cichlidogyrus casuarinus TaxID=1844966 RepID=A0ABD2Q2U2_9PLAT